MTAPPFAARPQAAGHPRPAEAPAEHAAAPDVRELVDRFPLPGVILHIDGSVEFRNARARRDVDPHWLSANGMRLVGLALQGQPEVMAVTDPSGQAHKSTAYAAPLGDRVVAVFDQYEQPQGSADVIALHRRILELERLSATDRLTGLWNRRHFDHVVDREISFSEAQLSPLSLLILDLDHFKAVNDRHGHAVGDEVLRLTASRLRAASRPTDLLFRWGGEEFAILAPAASLVAATALAQRLCASVSGGPVPAVGRMTLSAGVGEHVLGESAAHWFERVDSALLEAKHAGRNGVSVSPGTSSEAWAAQRGASALRLVWSESLESGHPLVDSQHRALFDATNRLMAAMTDRKPRDLKVLEQVDCLVAAVERHFADEEVVLAEARYPDLEAHRRSHAKLLEAARTLRAAVHAGTSSAGEVVEFLAYEIVNRHILKADRLFFPFVAPSAGTAAAVTDRS